MTGIYAYIKQFVNEKFQIWQEQKIEYPLGDVWISGTPDIIVIYNEPNVEDGIVAEIIDMKCWSSSWYDGPDIRRENAQWYFYPRFIFKQRHPEILSLTSWRTKKPKIKFTFLVMDKKSWEVHPFSKVLDESVVDTNVTHNVGEFIDIKSKNLDNKDYPAKQCRGCGMCPVADICPLMQKDLTAKEIINELF